MGATVAERETKGLKTRMRKSRVNMKKPPLPPDTGGPPKPANAKTITGATPVKQYVEQIETEIESGEVKAEKKTANSSRARRESVKGKGAGRPAVHKELGILNNHLASIKSAKHPAWVSAELRYTRTEGPELKENDEVRDLLEGTISLTEPEKEVWEPQIASAVMVRCNGREGCGKWLKAGHLREHFLCGHRVEEKEKDLLYKVGSVLANNAEEFGKDAAITLAELEGDLKTAYSYYCANKKQVELRQKYGRQNKATRTVRVKTHEKARRLSAMERKGREKKRLLSLQEITEEQNEAEKGQNKVGERTRGPPPLESAPTLGKSRAKKTETGKQNGRPSPPGSAPTLEKLQATDLEKTEAGKADEGTQNGRLPPPGSEPNSGKPQEKSKTKMAEESKVTRAEDLRDPKLTAPHAADEEGGETDPKGAEHEETDVVFDASYDDIHYFESQPAVIPRNEELEEELVEIQNGKKDLITGAFHIGTAERRRQRIADLRNIFDLQ